MIRRHQLVLLVDKCALPFAAHDDTVFCPFKMRQHHFTASLLRSLYSRLTAIRKRNRKKISTRIKKRSIYAHLTKFSKSAPENPGVPLARIVGSASSLVTTSRMWCFRICTRPRISGNGTAIILSNLPGLVSALLKRQKRKSALPP
jgi:hypothetical protein